MVTQALQALQLLQVFSKTNGLKKAKWNSKRKGKVMLVIDFEIDMLAHKSKYKSHKTKAKLKESNQRQSNERS